MTGSIELTGAVTVPGPVPGGTASADLALGISRRACELTVGALETYGNQLSEPHKEALRATAELFTDIASGDLRGRYAVDLPTGLGKTTSLVGWVKAVAEAGLPWSVAICANRVQELCDIYWQLTSGPAAVPAGMIGLWHSKGAGTEEEPLEPPTFPPGEAHRYASRPILLVTHARVRQGPRATEQLRHEQGHRDLVVYDESLLTTEPLAHSYPKLIGQIAEVRASLGHRAPEVGLLRELGRCLEDEAGRQQEGGAAKLIELPFRSADLSHRLQQMVDRMLGEDSHLWRLIARGSPHLRLLLPDGDPAAAAVIGFETVVPDDFDRMVVLDASRPIRRLLSLARERLNPAHRHCALVPAAEAKPTLGSPVKRYDRLTIHLMTTRRSGRNWVAKDLKRQEAEGSRVLAEVVAVVKAIPRDEAILLWTFLKNPDLKKHEQPLDFRDLTEQALRAAGIDPRATVDVGGGRTRPRIVIETFGRETASNAYKHCSNVIFMGCLERSKTEIAGHLVAESRDLLAEVSRDTIDELVRGEVYHRLYQGISRAACREVVLDEQGQTQAKATRVWVMSRHQVLQEALAPAFPGASWQPWIATVPDGRGACLQTKIEQAAQIIAQVLEETSEPRVSLRALRARVVGQLGEIANTTFQSARDKALEGSGWVIEKQTLVRLPDQRAGL